MDMERMRDRCFIDDCPLLHRAEHHALIHRAVLELLSVYRKLRLVAHTPALDAKSNRSLGQVVGKVGKERRECEIWSTGLGRISWIRFPFDGPLRRYSRPVRVFHADSQNRVLTGGILGLAKS